MKNRISNLKIIKKKPFDADLHVLLKISFSCISLISCRFFFLKGYTLDNNIMINSYLLFLLFDILY